ncbi:hypothetical protein DFH27DRAFT_574493 [Peziza echinospora]|nr:hypothetical protein DFH27DRAFT_574493 [Peziza echinospora]
MYGSTSFLGPALLFHSYLQVFGISWVLFSFFLLFIYHQVLYFGFFILWFIHEVFCIHS